MGFGRSNKKIILIFGHPEETETPKEQVRNFLRNKGIIRHYYVISAYPTDSNIAGCRNITNLSSVIIAGEIGDTAKTKIKRICKVEVFSSSEVSIFLKNLN